MQLSYTTIRAPISGRISAATVKVGNFVRSADLLPIATIIQTAPVYVSFPMPQVAAAGAARGDRARARPASRRSFRARRSAPIGRIAMIENTVDAATGMVNVRATMPNENELLWPGTLVQTYLNLRNEEAVTVPVGRRAGQPDRQLRLRHQERQVAELHPVKVARTLGDVTVLESGVDDGDTVVVERPSATDQRRARRDPAAKKAGS